jgi:hypothetical protein
MIRTTQGEYAPDEGLTINISKVQGISGVIAQRSRLTDTIIVESEPQPVTKMDMNTVPYAVPPVPPPTTSPPDPTTGTTPPPTTVPPTTTEPPTTTTEPPTTPPPTSSTLTPTSEQPE